MSSSDPRQQAAEYFQQAYESQVNGDYDQALDLYGRSIESYPTAEAYTFRGWTYSFMGRYDEAIAECHKAIEVDPTFGNPYNDIGAYLIEQRRWEESIPWLEQAIAAPRYDARCYPHFNLGRVYEHLRQWDKAKECYRRAWEANARYKLALAAFKRLSVMWN